MNDDWWKAAPASEGADEEETPVETEPTAGADGDESGEEENEKSPPEAPTADTTSAPTQENLERVEAVTTSSGESSSDKDPAPTPKKSRAAVSKAPESRLPSKQGPSYKTKRKAAKAVEVKRRKLYR